MIISKNQKRLEWVDIAKGIAIILMVIGHEVNNLNIHTLIFSFHMPLFFILSGYTSSQIGSWEKFYSKLKKNFVHVYLLALLMIMLLGVENLIFLKGFSLMSFFQSISKGIFWGSNIPTIGVAGVGVMWFLIVFFWAKVLFDLMQIIFSTSSIGIILIVMSGVSYFFCNNFRNFLPQAFDIVPFAALFMWIGLVAKNIKIKQIGKRKNYLTILSLTYWLICMRLHLFIELVIRHYPLFIVTILEAAAGTFVVCLFSKWLVPWAQKLQIVGQHTLAVLCIHHLDLYWVNWDSYILSFHSWLLASIARLVVDVTILGLFLFVQRWIMARKVK